jgi:hypothetical protein
MKNIEVRESIDSGVRAVRRKNIYDAVEVLYACTTGCEDILGCVSMIYDLNQVSITKIRKDNEEEKRTAIDFKPWGIGSIIACKEGLYVWDSLVNDYIMIGHIRETVRIQRIVVLQDYYAEVFMILTENVQTIHLKKGEIYELIDTIKCTDENGNNNGYDSLIALQSKQTAPFITPYSKERQQLQAKDLVEISYLHR